MVNINERFFLPIFTTHLLLYTYHYTPSTSHLLLTLHIIHYTFFKSITIL